MLNWLICGLGLSLPALAAHQVVRGVAELGIPSSEIKELGSHIPLFVIEKTHRRENILVAFTKLDASCEFIRESDRPAFALYWLDGGTRYHLPHPIIRARLNRRLKVTHQGPRQINVELKDLTEVKHDLHPPRVIVKASGDKTTGCRAEAVLPLGPSDQDRRLRLTKIFSDAKVRILPPSADIRSVTLSGTEVGTGKPFERRFDNGPGWSATRTGP